MKRRRKITHTNNTNEKESFNFSKRRFKARRMDKEGHCIMIKRSILPEDIMILNVYVPKKDHQNTWNKKLIETKEEINKSTLKVGDLMTPVSVIDQLSRKSVRI